MTKAEAELTARIEKVSIAIRAFVRERTSSFVSLSAAERLKGAIERQRLDRKIGLSPIFSYWIASLMSGFLTADMPLLEMKKVIRLCGQSKLGRFKMSP